MTTSIDKGVAKSITYHILNWPCSSHSLFTSAWRKYRACINGIRKGQSLASASERCPSRSFSRSAINAISDRLAGWPVSQCPSSSCKKSGWWSKGTHTSQHITSNWSVCLTDWPLSTVSTKWSNCTANVLIDTFDCLLLAQQKPRKRRQNTK